MVLSRNHFLVKLIESSLFQKLFNPNDTLSLETFLFRVRFTLWLMLLIFFGATSYLSYAKRGFTINFIYMFFCLFEIFLLNRETKDFIVGFLHVSAVLTFYFITLQNSDNYLRLFLTSFPTLALISLHGYPIYLWIFMTGGFFYLKNHFSGHLSNVYDPFSESYQVPASVIDTFMNSWSTLFILQVAALSFYQVIIRKMWKRYSEVRKNLEESKHRLWEANSKLAQSFDELDIKNKELQKALKSQDLFVACVSHELRNPLNVMLGNIEILSTEIMNTRQDQILQTCKLCGEALLRQINNLLDVSKMNANKFELNKTKVDMISFIEKFWNFAKIGLERKNLEGYLMVDRNLPKEIKIDEHHLHQVLDNLISNATKFTKQGSVRVTFRWISGKYSMNSYNFLEENYDIKKYKTLTSFAEIGEEKSPQPLRREMKKHSMTELQDFLCFKLGESFKQTLESILPGVSDWPESFLRIEVADTGCGISQEAQKKLFHPFVQADVNVSSVYGGTGLGLYIVKNIVEKMGGIIKLNSMKDVGTRFQIMIPMRDGMGNEKN